MWRTAVLLMTVALALGLIFANLPGSTDTLFWQSFLSTPRLELGWKIASYIVVPLISLACCATRNRTSNSKFASTFLLSVTVALTALSFMVTFSYAWKYLSSTNACLPICEVCNFVKAGLGVSTVVSFTYLTALCLSLKRKPLWAKFGSSNRFWVSALFLVSFLTDELWERYAWAQDCLHHGNWFS